MTLIVAKAFTMVVLGMLAAVEWLLGASQVQAVNTVLNFVSLAILMGGLFLAPRAFRARTAEADLKEKDRVIATWKQVAEAEEQKAEHLAEKAAELGGLLDEARHESATWSARYAEQEKYTAGPALAAIQSLMTHNQEESERRHRELLLALRALRHLVPGSPSLDDDV